MFANSRLPVWSLTGSVSEKVAFRPSFPEHNSLDCSYRPALQVWMWVTVSLNRAFLNKESISLSEYYMQISILPIRFWCVLIMFCECKYHILLSHTWICQLSALIENVHVNTLSSFLVILCQTRTCFQLESLDNKSKIKICDTK